MRLLIVFFGILDRGILETHRSLNAFVQNLRKDHSVTIACLDIAVPVVDDVPRCFGARNLLNCDVYMAYSDEFVRRRMRHTEPVSFDSSYYTPRLNRNAMVQLFIEQKVADYLHNVAALHDIAIVSSSDFLFMNEFDARALENSSHNSVMTSMQQNGADGYTNGFYVGQPQSVSKVMSRLRDIKNLTKKVKDYEYMLRSAFELHNVRHIPMQPWFFMKIRANCRVAWPVPYMSRTGRNPQTMHYYSKYRETKAVIERKRDCTCEHGGHRPHTAK